MSETVFIDPDREAWAIFKGLPADTPIHMLNLVRLRDRAIYPEGHTDRGRDLSGLDAYRAYGRSTAHILARVGGRQVWAGRPEVTVTGPPVRGLGPCLHRRVSLRPGLHRHGPRP